MAYTEGIDWTNGEKITEVKLDNMAGNSDHNRETNSYFIVPGMRGSASESDGYSSSSTWRLLLLDDETELFEIDTQTIPTGALTNILAGDVDCSTIPAGLYKLSVGWRVGASGIIRRTTPEVRVYLTEDMNRLSVWYDVTAQTTSQYLNVQDIIFHREDKSWT